MNRLEIEAGAVGTAISIGTSSTHKGKSGDYIVLGNRGYERGRARVWKLSKLEEMKNMPLGQAIWRDTKEPCCRSG